MYVALNESIITNAAESLFIWGQMQVKKQGLRTGCREWELCNVVQRKCEDCMYDHLLLVNGRTLS